ncbi:aminomethyl-transferring glycine dehydrogenase subunit 1 [Bacillaceae bacterium]
MRFRYLPMTDEDKKEMLSFLGIRSVEELFADVPREVRYEGKLNLSPALSEPELVRHMTELARKNAHTKEYVSFLGAGVYEHYVPSVVGHVISRSEFYTAYTPYQPEISQGELQAMFEFQTMICELTGMDAANSSLYDGATAVAEGAALAAGHTKRGKVVVSRTVHPETREVLQSYCRGQNIEVREVGYKEGVTDLSALEREVDAQTAAVIVQYPNFFGAVEDLAQIERIAHGQNALFIVSANPLALGILQPPGAFHADVVAGDVQPCGIPLQFGGPHGGYFAVKEHLVRRMPGRVVGQTKDEEGRRGFVLTLQAREQHIRRERATSNICSNQALNALAAAVWLTALGKQGIQEIAMLNLQKSHYAQRQITALPGYEAPFDQPFFNEFVVKVPGSVHELNRRLLERGIIGGYDLGRDYPELAGCMLIAVTDVRTKQEIDRFVSELGGVR